MPEPPKKVLCPECDKEVPAEAKECPFCKLDLEATFGLARMLRAATKINTPEKAPEPEPKKRDAFAFLRGNKK